MGLKNKPLDMREKIAYGVTVRYQSKSSTDPKYLILKI